MFSHPPHTINAWFNPYANNIDSVLGQNAKRTSPVAEAASVLNNGLSALIDDLELSSAALLSPEATDITHLIATNHK